MIKLLLLTLMLPQPPASFPSQLARGQSTPASIYPDYGFVIWEGARPADIVRLNDIIDSVQLLKVLPKDTSRKFTKHPQGAWLERGNGPPMTAKFWAGMQAKLPAKIFVTPAYVVGPPRPDRVFAPIPNLLIVTQAVMTNALRSQLASHGFKYDSMTSRSLSAQVVYKTQRENAVLAREKILNSLSNAHYVQNLRFEQLPLMRERPSGNTSGFCPQPDNWNMTMIQATPPRTLGTNPVRVAVFDYGVEADHHELNVDPGIDLFDNSPADGPVDGNSHGTNVAGVIGAKKDNGGVSGVAPGVRIVPVNRWTGSDLEVARGLAYCRVNKIDIVNMSFGRVDDWRDEAGSVWQFDLINPEIEAAADAGILLIAAAGNDNASIQYPARHPDVMAIGASDQHDKRWHHSNYGDVTWNGSKVGISVVAPGDEVCTTTIGDSYNTFGATSAATPHVAGLAALLKSYDATLTAASLREHIEGTAVKIDQPALSYATMTGYSAETRNGETGYGRIDVAGAYGKAILHDLKAISWMAIITSVEFEGITGDRIGMRNAILRVLISNAALAHDCAVDVMVVRAGQAIAYRDSKFITERGIRLKPVKVASEGSETVFSFDLDPEMLTRDAENARWQAIAVAYEKTFSSDDLRKALEHRHRNVAMKEFELETSSNFSWIFLILLLIAGGSFVLWRSKAKRSATRGATG